MACETQRAISSASTPMAVTGHVRCQKLTNLSQATVSLRNSCACCDKGCMCRYVCDERWYNLTRSIRLRGLGFAGQDSLRQPTWCTLPPDKFHALSARASQQQRPENILLIYKTAPKPRPARVAPRPAVSNVTRAGLPVAALPKPQSLQVSAAPRAIQ